MQLLVLRVFDTSTQMMVLVPSSENYLLFYIWIALLAPVLRSWSVFDRLRVFFHRLRLLLLKTVGFELLKKKILEHAYFLIGKSHLFLSNCFLISI